MLIDLLEDRGDFVRHLALERLNEIEHQRLFLGRASELPRVANDYLARRNQSEFRAMMVNHLVDEPSAGWQPVTTRWQRLWRTFTRR